MRDLWLYEWMARFKPLNYRAKIMSMAFIGTHIPLICLAVYFAVQTSKNWSTILWTVGITLAATLAGTGLTLYVLNELLRPVIATSRALRLYREDRSISSLPSHHTDEVGTLMADASLTIAHLEAVRDALEYFDARTGLPNRKRFEQSVESRFGKSQPFAVAVVRFANYGRISETFDLEQAELAARTIGQRFAEAGLGETLSRIGEGEFAAIRERTNSDPVDFASASAALSGLLKSCSADLGIDGTNVKPTLTGGVACWPEDSATAAVLIDNAVAAAATANLGIPVVMHSPAARAAAAETFKIEQQLRRALERDEFRLHYQPVIDIAAGRVTGAEALIRWEHPDLGLLAPARFIPVAETSGLIEPIGLWVMNEACRQVRVWNDAGRSRLKVAVNLSARQFLNPELTRQVAETLSGTGISPDQLEVELTETAAMADHDFTRRAFIKLRDLGVSIAIDDFGTGYASMSYLRKLPFDKLKIDREFVSDVATNRNNQAICQAMIALAKGLDLKVLAEGTETETEVAYLANLGCDLFQGYFFGRPMPESEFALVVDAIALKDTVRRMALQPSAPAETRRHAV